MVNPYVNSDGRIPVSYLVPLLKCQTGVNRTRHQTTDIQIALSREAEAYRNCDEDSNRAANLEAAL